MGARGLHCDAIESHSCWGRHSGVYRVRYVCFVVCRLRSAFEDGAAGQGRGETAEGAELVDEAEEEELAAQVVARIGGT